MDIEQLTQRIYESAMRERFASSSHFVGYRKVTLSDNGVLTPVKTSVRVLYEPQNELVDVYWYPDHPNAIELYVDHYPKLTPIQAEQLEAEWRIALGKKVRTDIELVGRRWGLLIGDDDLSWYDEDLEEAVKNAVGIVTSNEIVIDMRPPIYYLAPDGSPPPVELQETAAQQGRKLEPILIRL